MNTKYINIKTISSVVFLAVTIFLVWWVFFAAPNLNSKSEDFLEKIKAQEFAEAHDEYLSSSFQDYFQESNNEQDLESFFKNFEDYPEDSEWSLLPDFHAEDTFLHRGDIQLKGDNNSFIQFTYIKEDWDWKIYAIQIGGVSLEDKKDISWQTVKDIVDVASSEGKTIEDIISKAWRKQIEKNRTAFEMSVMGLGKLENITFDNLRGSVINSDESGENIENHIDEAKKGIINLKTFFTTDTAIGYLDVDYIREFLTWKPMGLNVQIRCYVENCPNINEEEESQSQPRSIIIAIDNARGLSPKERELNDDRAEDEIKSEEALEIRNALKDFIREVMKNEDNIGLLVYDDEMNFSEFKRINQLDELITHLENLDYSGGRTYTEDAINSVVDSLENEAGEKVLIIIDDGSDSRGNVRKELAEKATTRLQQENITTYAIGITGIDIDESRTPGEFNRINELIDLVFSISYGTNGEYYFAVNSNGVVDALKKLRLNFAAPLNQDLPSQNSFDLVFNPEQEFKIDPLFSSITARGQGQFSTPNPWWVTWLPGLIIGIAIIIAALIMRPKRAPEVISIIPVERMCIELASIGKGNYDFEEAFPGVKSITIGSDENSDIVLEGEDINNKHARISYEQGHYVLSDISAKNNVYCNEMQVITPCVLEDKAEIVIGQTRYLVRINKMSTGETSVATGIGSEQLAPTKAL